MDMYLPRCFIRVPLGTRRPQWCAHYEEYGARQQGVTCQRLFPLIICVAQLEGTRLALDVLGISVPFVLTPVLKGIHVGIIVPVIIIEWVETKVILPTTGHPVIIVVHVVYF